MLSRRLRSFYLLLSNLGWGGFPVYKNNELLSVNSLRFPHFKRLWIKSFLSRSFLNYFLKVQ